MESVFVMKVRRYITQAKIHQCEGAAHAPSQGKKPYICVTSNSSQTSRGTTPRGFCLRFIAHASSRGKKTYICVTFISLHIGRQTEVIACDSYPEQATIVRKRVIYECGRAALAPRHGQTTDDTHQILSLHMGRPSEVIVCSS